MILVDDASPDDTLEKAKGIARAKPWVKIVALARNVGQHPAISAGLAYAQGRRVAIMDGDLQHPPEALRLLWERAEAGADVVIATFKSRTDGPLRRLGSATFWRIMRLLLGAPVISNQLTLRILSRPVVDAVLAHREQVRLISILNALAGFRQESVPVQPRRRTGKSSYGVLRLLRLLNEHVIASSQTPLYVVLAIGFLVLFGTFSFSLRIVILTLLHGSLPGWPSMAVLVSFLGGLTIAGVGVLGVYLGETLREVKRRPIFVVRELVGLDPDAYRAPTSLPAAPLLASSALSVSRWAAASVPLIEAIMLRGYGVLDETVAASICEELGRAVDESLGSGEGQGSGRLFADERFRSLVEHTRILGLVDAILGADASLHAFDVVVSSPGRPGDFSRDFAQDFVATRILCLSAIWALDDLEIGVVPQTHREATIPSRDFLERNVVSVPLRRGSVLVFDSMLIRRDAPCLARRRAVHVQYARGFVKPRLDATTLVTGVPPGTRLAQLLGSAR